MRIGLGLGLTRRNGGTPTPTPGTLDVIYNASLDQFEVTNAVDFPGTKTWRLRSDNSVISGQTGDTLAAALADGDFVTCELASYAATRSVGTVKPINYTIQDIDFDALTTGTKLSSLGWTAATQIETNGTVLQKTSSASANPDRTFSAGQYNQRITIRPQFLTTPGNTPEATSTQRGILLSYGAGGNYIHADIRHDQVIIQKRVGNTPTTIVSPLSGSNLNAESMTAQLVWVSGVPYLQVLRDNVRIDAGGNGINLNSSGAALVQNAGASLSFPNSTGTANPAFPIPLLRGLKVEAWATGAIVVGNLTVSTPTAVLPLILNVSGTVDSAGNYEAWAIDQYGRDLTGVTGAALSSGAFDIDVTANDTLRGRTDTQVYLRNAADYASAICYPIALVPEYYPYVLPMWGLQTGNVAGWSEEDIFTDKGVMTAWAVRASGAWATTVPFKDNGTPDAEAVAGFEYADAKIWESGVVGYGRGGQYLVSWEMNNVTASWQNLTNATAGAIDNSAKTALVTISEMVSVGAHLRFTPTGGGTAGDYRVTAIRVGETSTGPINDKAAPSMASNPFYRYMKVQGVEAPYTATVNSPYLIERLRSTPELIGGASNQLDNIPWICFPTNDNDTWITQYATRLKAVLRTGVPVWLEYGNEPWNGDYFRIIGTIDVRALNAGLVPGVAAPVGEQYQDGSAGSLDPWTNAATGVTNRVIAAGTRGYVTADNYQVTAFEAKAELPIGYIIPDIQPATTFEDADIKIVALYAPLFTGRYRYIVQRTHEIKQIFEAVFGEDNEIFTILDIQQGTSNAIIASWLTHNPTYGKTLGAVCPSHYLTANYAWASAPAWMKDPANAAAWQSNFTTMANTALTTTTSILSGHKGLYAVLRAAGWEPNEIPVIGTYEGELHFVLKDIPAGATATAIGARIADWRASSECYNLIYDMMTAFDALGLSFYCDFAQHQAVGTATGTSQFGYLRAVNSYNDPTTGSTDKKWHARADYLAATRP